MNKSRYKAELDSSDCWPDAFLARALVQRYAESQSLVNKTRTK